jgi:thiamine-phosphate pyrophosphorylase
LIPVMGVIVAAAVRLMLVTADRFLPEARLMNAVALAVEGGVTSVQLRLKTVSARELLRIARIMVDQLPVPVVINDRPDVARAARAAGVHLGPGDLSVARARGAWPEAPMVGASVGQASEVNAGEGADYWGVGPWHATGTKPDAGAAIGPDGFRAVVARAGPRPCIAIGGIQPADLPEVFAAGGAGVAVVSGILAAEDIRAAAREYAVHCALNHDVA